MNFKRFAMAMLGHFLASLLYVLEKLRLVNVAVDTSSILEHREEIRELWEKRMMSEDNQSLPSSASVADPKPAQEEGSEEVIAKNESETQMPNGTAKHNETTKDTKQEINTQGDEDDQAPDSLEIHSSETVEEKVTSELETSTVVKETTDTPVTEGVKEGNLLDFDDIVTPAEIKTVVSEVDGKAATTENNTEGIVEVTADEVMAALEKKEVLVPEVKNSETKIIDTEKPEEKVDSEMKEVVEKKPSEEKSFESKPFKGLELEINIKDTDDDGFVSVEECLPKIEGEEDVFSELSTDESKPITPISEQKITLTNGHSSPAVSITPEPETKLQPEMEAFVKSGGVKRILPNVQKTEQPYSSCTTETKIAMEIREMREREEELRVMRERSLTSPQPPQVAKTPSPQPPVCSPSPTPGPGYKVSNVFGRGSPVEPAKGFVKETNVEKEIRLAKDREEELRKQQGLPPRDDDSYVKPSEVKSSQVRVFGKVGSALSMKQAATAKIQLEIEEQTQREMALRETGSIQTISQERTDAKVAKLKTPEEATYTNGTTTATNGTIINGSGRGSPDVLPYKRGSPSPTGLILNNNSPRPASIFSQNGKNSISMHKFIASKGKETTAFNNNNNNGIRSNGVLSPTKVEDVSPRVANVPPTMIKLKRAVSVESKIQQEIMEMKQREEELKLLHSMNQNDNSEDENGLHHEMNNKNYIEYENGNGYDDEDLNPRHNKLIAQWEQRIQKAES